MILLGQSILERRRISHLHSSALFTTPLKEKKNRKSTGLLTNIKIIFLIWKILKIHFFMPIDTETTKIVLDILVLEYSCYKYSRDIASKVRSFFKYLFGTFEMITHPLLPHPLFNILKTQYPPPPPPPPPPICKLRGLS